MVKDSYFLMSTTETFLIEAFRAVHANLARFRHEIANNFEAADTLSSKLLAYVYIYIYMIYVNTRMYINKFDTAETL